MKPSNEYLDIVRKLPRPSLDQTEKFLNNFSTIHSWYKKLGYPKGKAFLFYLDPNAGRLFYYKGTKDYYHKDCWKENWPKLTTTPGLPENDEPFQLNYNETERYLTRYGHWSYYTNGDDRIWEITEENGMIEKYSGIGYNILTPENKLILMPDNIKELGTVEINKLIWEITSPVNLDLFFNEKTESELLQERNELINKIEDTMKKILDYIYD